MVEKEKNKKINIGEIIGYSVIVGDGEIEEIMDREITKWGTGAHVGIPKIHLGKQARILIKKKDKTKNIAGANLIKKDGGQI